MPSNSEHAERIIDAYVQLRRGSDQVFVTYGQMAKLIGRAGQHRFLGAPLDLVRDYCNKRGLPDVATVVVSKESLSDGTVKPSAEAVAKHNGWAGLRAEQARVIACDWSKPV